MRIAVIVVIALGIVALCLFAYREHVAAERREEMAMAAQIEKARAAYEEITGIIDGALAATGPSPQYLDRTRATVREVLGPDRAAAVFKPQEEAEKTERPVLMWKRPPKSTEKTPGEEGLPAFLTPRSVLDRQRAVQKGEKPPPRKPDRLIPGKDQPAPDPDSGSLIPGKDKPKRDESRPSLIPKESQPGPDASVPTQVKGIRLVGREIEIVELFRKADKGFRSLAAETDLTKSLRADIQAAYAAVRETKTPRQAADKHEDLLQYEAPARQRAKTLGEMIAALEQTALEAEKVALEIAAERKRIEEAMARRKEEEARKKRALEERVDVQETLDRLANTLRECRFNDAVKTLQEKRRLLVTPAVRDKVDTWIERFGEMEKVFAFVLKRARHRSWPWGWKDSRGAQDILSADKDGVRIRQGTVSWDRVGPDRTIVIMKHYLMAGDVPDDRKGEMALGAMLFCQMHNRFAAARAYEQVVRKHRRELEPRIEKLQLSEDEALKMPEKAEPARR